MLPISQNSGSENCSSFEMPHESDPSQSESDASQSESDSSENESDSDDCSPEKDDTNEFMSPNTELDEVILKGLKKYFKHEDFKPKQMAAVKASLSEHDLLILMPICSGKSVCYQLPALLEEGLTVIISPLISYMIDQVRRLEKLGITAEYLREGLDDFDLSSKLLFVTPEKINMSERLKSTLRDFYNVNSLKRFVIDEAHCVSEWGHDFRPEYKELYNLRNVYEGVPFTVVTSIYKRNVICDVLEQLRLKTPKRIILPYTNRENLKYIVCQRTNATEDKIIALIKNYFHKESGIIFCRKIEDSKKIASKLCENGINAVSYSSELSYSDREKYQREWSDGSIQIIVATASFSRGISKQNVRFIIHYSVPKSLEGYYLETGKAGRDGKPSFGILFYSCDDVSTIRYLIGEDGGSSQWVKSRNRKLTKMEKYCREKGKCRKYQLSLYFDKTYQKIQCVTDCDICNDDIMNGLGQPKRKKSFL